VVKCPFCGFGNEEGALFCEQCKSDVSNVAPTPSSPSGGPPPTPMPGTIPPMDAYPVAAFEEAPVMAAIVEEDVPVVAIVEEEPPIVEIIEEAPPAAAVAEPPPAPPAAVVAEAPAPPPPPPMMAPDVAAAEAAPPPAAATAKPVAAGQIPIPIGAAVKLIVQRGVKVGEEYSLFGGENFIGRADEKPVDVDLTFQEPEDRVWCSRQHALIVFDDATGVMTIEDLNSSNGTFVNRERVYPGQPRQLYVGNTIQIGTVHMKIKV